MRVLHMNGAGNSFAVLDARDQELDLSTLAVTLCERFGADGLMAVDNSQIADFRLHFYNANGARGEMCGNGSRCVCRFAHGIAGDSMTVQTDAGIIRCWRLDESNYRVLLNNPGLLDLSRREDAAYVELGNPGIPHAVAELPRLSWDRKEDLRSYGIELRYDPAFPKGANVNFFSLINEEEARVLTYERYVENYTLACGTGCASVATVLYTQGRLPGGKLTCHCPGGILQIRLEGSEGKIQKLYLEGPTEIEGIYEI